jgi:hypothetical protein
MLVEFSVTNFRSIRDKQTLSMVKGKGSELEATHTFKPTAPSSETLLKSAAIYGANAAGKSNIIKALSMMKQIVVQPPNVGEKLPVVPFMFDPETPQQPTEFELVFITDNVRYQYGFSATAERIWSEWLFAFPKGRSQRWFEREYSPQTGDTWHLDTNLKGEKKVWRDSTRENALFLSTAAQLNSESLSPLYAYFNKIRGIRNDIASGLLSARILTSESLKHLITSTLIDADVGISNISTEKNEDEIPKNQSLESDINILRRIHGIDYSSKLEDESDGTKELFNLSFYIKMAIECGYPLIIDEINAKLHPTLVRYLIGLFNSVEHNPRNAQLIFTTHETSILDQDLLRRDQVWFCEKDENQATRLYSLLDFKPRKGHENLEAAYLSGRYGAIPMINAR